jgi:hypothetical protein
VTLRFKLQLVVMSDDQEVCVNDVVVLDKQHERLEHLGLSLAEAKTASVAPPCRWLPDGRLCLSRAPGHVGMPDWPATAPDPYRPNASTHALSSASRGMQPLPAKSSCTDSDTGREVTRSLDPWLQTEIGRFHQGLSLVLALLAGLILTIAVLRNHADADMLVLGPTLLVAVLAVRHRAGVLRSA